MIVYLETNVSRVGCRENFVFTKKLSNEKCR